MPRPSRKLRPGKRPECVDRERQERFLLAAFLFFGFGFGFVRVVVFRFFAGAAALRFARSGSFLPPVSRFHSSNVSFEILPSTRSCANFRRCAWLLNGICSPVCATFRDALPRHACPTAGRET